MLLAAKWSLDSECAPRIARRMKSGRQQNCSQSEFVAHACTDNALVELYRNIGDERRTVRIGDCASCRARAVGKVDKEVFCLSAPISASCDLDAGADRPAHLN